MTAFPPLVVDSGRVRRLDGADALEVSQIDSVTLTLNCTTVNAQTANLLVGLITGPSGTIVIQTNDLYVGPDPPSTGNVHATTYWAETGVITPTIVSLTDTVSFSDNDITTTGNITANVATVNSLDNVDFVQFDTTYSDGKAIGKLQWNDEVGTLEFGLAGGEVNLQIGQEQVIPVRNVSGGTLLNGRLVYYTGTDSGLSTVDYADATRENWPKAIVRGILTENIANTENGYMLIAGVIHDVDTDGYTPGAHIWLSTVGDGSYTATRPTSPDYVMGIGTVTYPHLTDGTIQIEFDRLWDIEWASNVQFSPAYETDQFLGWKPERSRYELLRSQRNFFNGTTRESFDATINSTDNSTIQLYLEQAGGGDLTMQFTDGDTTLDCTPAQTINITPGTDTSPAGTMVYIPYSTKNLTSASAWPDEEHIKICYLAVPSAQFVYELGGPYVNQNWNDHLSDTEGVIGQGHLTHVAGKIRLALGASWYSGVSPDGQDESYFTFPAASTIYWESTAGVIAQLHPQAFGAKDTGNGNVILVANDFVAPYTYVSNLFDITADSTGSTIGNNRYFSLIFWGVQNKSDQGSGVVINLPAGNYTLEANALTDSENYDDYNFPREFTLDSGTAFLIARSTFKMGTTGWTHIQTEDLRGKVPSNQAGGGGGSTNDHGSLGGLADDDHTQYALVDGSRAFTGNVTMPALIVGGDLTSNTGTINLNDDHLVTTGNLTCNTIFFPGGPCITGTGGIIDFGDDHTVTTGNTTANTYSATNYIRTDTLRTYSGTLSMPSGGNFYAAGYVSAGGTLSSGGGVYTDDIQSLTGTVVDFGSHDITTTGDIDCANLTVTGVIYPATYNDSTRPAASGIAAGGMIYNTDDNAPNFSDGTNWRDAAGTVT